MQITILRKTGHSLTTCRGIIENIQRDDVKLLKSNERNNGADILIRWGSTAIFPSKIVINTPEMIHLAADKIETRRQLIEKGISVPKTFFQRSKAMQFMNECSRTNKSCIIIGRKRQHSQGRKIVISHNNFELGQDRSEYWSEFIPKDREFRVYVFFGRILGISEKIPDYPQKIAWNKSLGNGAFINLKLKELPRDVGLLALRAADALKIDMGAMDLISKGNSHYVLECNGTPDLSPYRQFLFGRAFNWLIKKIEQNGEKPEHFKLPRTAQDKMVLLCKK
jgi:glutathione synthase/RimK-type ligase-like ATP-grasp enzyme